MKLNLILKTKALSLLISQLDQQKDPMGATNLARFFKTGKGEYGKGDQFLGLVVPQIREAVRLSTGARSRSQISMSSSPAPITNTA